MGSYEDAVRTLEVELRGVEQAFRDDLLARKTVAGRPADLADDLAWVRAASGRAEHADPRLPLIG